MKLIIGLGNPGKDYENTRHNVGYMIVDRFRKIGLSKGVMVKKSDVFMNSSGEFVKKITELYPLSSNSLYIVHDDLDIPLGSYKIQFGRGPKDHNGLKSVDEALGTDQYWHVRVGIENRAQSSEVSGYDYVLQNFSDEERIILKMVVQEVCHKLDNI